MMTDRPAPDAPVVPPAPPVAPWDRVDRFMGQFIHDIRNGLNALELQLTLLGEVSVEPEVRQEVKEMRGSLAALSRELQSTRTAVGPVQPRPMPYPADELLEDLRERLGRRPGLESLTTALPWEVDPGVRGSMVHVDPELVFDAVLRLFDNAVAFRETPTASVGFHAGADGSCLVLRLLEAKSSPPGSPDSLAAWGRNPLVSTRRGSHAYGLGLFRARRIIEAHGGALAARYLDDPGTLETRVELPLATSPTPP